MIKLVLVTLLLALLVIESQGQGCGHGHHHGPYPYPHHHHHHGPYPHPHHHHHHGPYHHHHGFHHHSCCGHHHGEGKELDGPLLNKNPFITSILTEMESGRFSPDEMKEIQDEMNRRIQKGIQEWNKKGIVEKGTDEGQEDIIEHVDTEKGTVQKMEPIRELDLRFSQPKIH